MLEDHRNMYRCKSLHLRANRWGQTSEEHLSKRQFLHVLRRVAYLSLPHRHSNTCTVFLEIKLLTLFLEYVFGLWWVFRDYSTICNMGKMQNFWDSTNGKWNEWGALWGLGDCQNLILTISHCCFAENGTSSYFSAQHVQHDYFLHTIDLWSFIICRCCSLTLSYTAHRALTCFITV